MRSYSTLGGMEFVRAIWVERQKRSERLQVYSGPALVGGASGSAGGQQSPFNSPHAASSVAQRPVTNCAEELQMLAYVANGHGGGRLVRGGVSHLEERPWVQGWAAASGENNPSGCPRAPQGLLPAASMPEWRASWFHNTPCTP